MPDANRTADAMPRASARGKSVPQRTCIACRTTGDKRALVRVVRGLEGVEVDPTGKKAGRGAYLCRRPECWREALKKNRLDVALKTRLSKEDKLRLSEYIAGMSAVTV
jgi:predicted RNA-binding protein YlxR (DUF448 family)